MLSRVEQEEYLELLEEQVRRQKRTLFTYLFPDEDTATPEVLSGFFNEGIAYARSRYPRHMEFFKAGAIYRERCFLAGNRVGKTSTGGGYEMACHLTGRYPDWWEGRRFTRPIRAWAAGKTNETTRDAVQSALFGRVKSENNRRWLSGEGIIPGDTVGKTTWRNGVADLADTIQIKHVTGENSVLGLKSYHQGRDAFEGTAQDAVWLDEEPPQDVYGECLIRTATTDGIVMLTFTPLEGMSEVVMGFMPKEMQLDQKL